MAGDLHNVAPVCHTQPMLGIAGVLLGAALATFLGRLLSVGAADLRGALHIDFDSAAWLGTAYNMGLMFIGPFSVYLGGLLGARRVLLACAAIFSLVCLVLPLAVHLEGILGLLVIGGLTAGTFYPLTLSFVLKNLPQRYMLLGIAAYSIDIVVSTHIAHSYEAWLLNTLSWRWIFWTGTIATPLMMGLIYFGIPPQPLPTPKPGQPRPSWQGFLYLSLGAALIYGSLDQAQRVNWWRSSTFAALFITGMFLMVAAGVRHLRQPNPLISLRFLRQGNTFLLGIILVFFRFGLLAGVVLVPTYLGTVAGYSAEQIGPILLWIAVPQFVAGILAVAVLGKLDSRIILATGFTMIAGACIANAQLTSVWSGTSFVGTQLLLSLGEALAFSGLVGTIVLELVNSGSLDKGIDVLTFAGFFQSVRLLGGEIGVSFIQWFLQRRELFHSNVIGLHVQRGSMESGERWFGLSAAMLRGSASSDVAIDRAAVLIGLTVRKQAFTIAVADSFRMIAAASIFCLVVIACMSTLRVQYKQVTSAVQPPTQ